MISLGIVSRAQNYEMERTDSPGPNGQQHGHSPCVLRSGQQRATALRSAQAPKSYFTGGVL